MRESSNPKHAPALAPIITLSGIATISEIQLPEILQYSDLELNPAILKFCTPVKYTNLGVVSSIEGQSPYMLEVSLQFGLVPGPDNTGHTLKEITVPRIANITITFTFFIKIIISKTETRLLWFSFITIGYSNCNELRVGYKQMGKISSRLYCFSPPAMIAIFVLEIALAIYTFWRFRMKSIARIVVTMLILLALFQLSEYHVCGANSNYSLGWSRVGFVAITLLPALALHLIHKIAHKKVHYIVWIAYIMSLVFAVIFGLSPSAFAHHLCTGNYAVFHLTGHLGAYYFAFYYTWLIVGIGLSLYYAIDSDRKTRTALILHVCGYLSFLLPTALVNTINPTTIAGLPSVMCGFAVIYALILVLGIVPNTSDLPHGMPKDEDIHK